MDGQIIQRETNSMGALPWRKLALGVALSASLAGCAELPSPQAPSRPNPPAPQTSPAASGPTQSPREAVNMFVAVVERMEPVAERMCRERAPSMNCDFEIVVDTREGQPPNAYQTVNAAGRPILAFTVALIADVRNADELAFVMGHEAAHHISGHLARTQSSAMLGGMLGGILASVTGAGQAGVEAAQNLGATVGARSYSKGYELEADQLGTVITYHAGYNPERGAQFFTRIPDPGDRFLGSHPPNAQRIETVRRTLSTLR